MNEKIIVKDKDWHFFTTKCCLCKDCADDDKDMVPIYIERNSYFEPDYCCKRCLNERKIENVSK